jgi:hypothetical protein
MTFPTGPFTDLGVELHSSESRRVPIERVSTTDVLVNIAQLMTEQLAALQHIEKRLGDASDSRSSVEIKTSTRGVDVTVKAYAGSDILEARATAG